VRVDSKHKLYSREERWYARATTNNLFSKTRRNPSNSRGDSRVKGKKGLKLEAGEIIVEEIREEGHQEGISVEEPEIQIKSKDE
jgi:hypothetical protein